MEVGLSEMISVLSHILGLYISCTSKLRYGRGRLLFLRRQPDHPTLRHTSLYTSEPCWLPFCQKSIRMCRRPSLGEQCPSRRVNSHSP